MHALDHGAVLRRHQAGRLGAGDAERVHGLVGIELEPARRAGRGRENPDRGAGMPALADMLLAHAQADARPDLVAGDGGGEEIAAGQLRVALGDGDQRRQRHRADMEHGLAVHVVELESLHLGAVEQRRMRRRQLSVGAPDRGGARCVERFERAAQDAAPFEVGAVDGAAERIENEKFYPLADLGGDLLVGQARDEFGDFSRVNVVGAGMGGHAQPLLSGVTARRFLL